MKQKLTMTVVADSDEQVLDAVEYVGKMGTRHLSPGDPNARMPFKHRTPDGAEIVWSWEPV